MIVLVILFAIMLRVLVGFGGYSGIKITKSNSSFS